MGLVTAVLLEVLPILTHRLLLLVRRTEYLRLSTLLVITLRPSHQLLQQFYYTFIHVKSIGKKDVCVKIKKIIYSYDVMTELIGEKGIQGIYSSILLIYI